MSEDSSKYSESDDCNLGLDEEEYLTTYKALYGKDNAHVNFSRDFVPIIVEGLESMVFSTMISRR